MREDTKSLQEHFEEFKTDGFTLFPKMLDDSWVKAMRDSFEEIGDRMPNPDGSRPQAFVDVLEHKPDLMIDDYCVYWEKMKKYFDEPIVDLYNQMN